MTVKKRIKSVMQSSAPGRLLFLKLRVPREHASMRRYKDDYDCISAIYRERFGRELDLVNPKSYTEKLQWFKLFYHDPDMVVCADKYAVREYLAERGYAYLLNGLIGVYDNANDIDFDALPNRFAAKANHGSGWNLICTDKSKLNIFFERRIMNQWLKLDLAAFGREWYYSDIKRKIVIEEFIDAKPLNDYKFMCFNGEPKFMQINHDYEGKHYVDFLDMDWKRTGFTYRGYTPSSAPIDVPSCFSEMVTLAKELSKPFPFVRVDFYDVDGKVVFGELTFFPGGGLLPIVPNGRTYDESLGDLLTLPEPNYNLELYEKLKSGVKHE